MIFFRPLIADVPGEPGHDQGGEPVPLCDRIISPAAPGEVQGEGALLPGLAPRDLQELNGGGRFENLPRSISYRGNATASE